MKFIAQTLGSFLGLLVVLMSVLVALAVVALLVWAFLTITGAAWDAARSL